METGWLCFVRFREMKGQAQHDRGRNEDGADRNEKRETKTKKGRDCAENRLNHRPFLWVWVVELKME